jgi:hypothetical protein
MSILTYISRKLRIFSRPKRVIFPPNLPVNIAWQQHPIVVLKKVNWQRLQERRKLLYPVPNTPFVPPTGETFGGANTKFLYYTFRKLKLPRPRKVLPSFVVIPPVGFIPWHRSLLRFISKRPIKRFFRNVKRAYPIFIPIPPVGFIARPNKLIRVKRRRTFPFHHKVYLFPGAPLPPPTISSGRQIWEEELDDLTLATHKWHQRLIDAAKVGTTGEEIRKIAQKLGKMGGIARAESMTSKQRSQQASKAAITRWRPK